MGTIQFLTHKWFMVKALDSKVLMTAARQDGRWVSALLLPTLLLTHATLATLATLGGCG